MKCLILLSKKLYIFIKQMNVQYIIAQDHFIFTRKLTTSNSNHSLVIR